MIIYSIYKVVNTINGKVYIGFDSNWPQRKKRHLKDSSYKKSVGYNDIFHKAIRKYGKENFEWQIIYQSKDGQNCLKEMEPHFIKEHNSYIYFNNSNGYNMTLGGDGVLGLKKSEESKLKTSLSCGKEYKFWKLNGTLVQFKNLKKYSEEYGFSKSLLGRVNLEKKLSYREHIKYYENKTFEECLEIYLDKKKNSMNVMGEKHSKNWKIKCPDGKIIHVFNLSKFCDSIGLNHRTLRNLKTLKGYSLT
jgi:group I intron endonuclease